MNSNFFQRVKIRKYYAQVFSRIGQSYLDAFKLAWLGWRRVDVPIRKSSKKARRWSARLNSLNGLMVHLCPDDICHVGIFEEVIVHQAYDFGLLGSEPELILDVGAHIGLFSLCAAARWPRASILAFEPHPENAVWTRRNLSTNGIRGSLIEAAVGSKPGLMNFSLGGGMGALSSTGDTKVITIDLVAVLKAFPSLRLLLKIDIEGGEMAILPDLLPHLPPDSAMFIELHGSQIECDEMIAKITSSNFSLKVLHNKQSDDGNLRFLDLFIKPVQRL